VFKFEDSVIFKNIKKKDNTSITSIKALNTEYINDRETVTSSIEQPEIAIQTTKDTKETPRVIKQLITGLILFFIAILSLILIEAVLHHDELEKTKNWFKLSEYYGLRYVILSYLASAPITYDFYRKYESIEKLQVHLDRTKERIEKVYELNRKTRIYMEDLDFIYDYELLLTNSKGKSFPTSFLYAMLMVSFSLIC
jgi:hypothetical protein